MQLKQTVQIKTHAYERALQRDLNGNRKRMSINCVFVFASNTLNICTHTKGFQQNIFMKMEFIYFYASNFLQSSVPR